MYSPNNEYSDFYSSGISFENVSLDSKSSIDQGQSYLQGPNQNSLSSLSSANQHEYGYTAPFANFNNSDGMNTELIYDPDDPSQEPPLLQELGIYPDHIMQKTLAVLNPLKVPDAEVMLDADLAGPLLFCLVFGATLLLQGKVQFGFIYGIGVLGCVGIYSLLNMMTGGISIITTVSILGYCLLPIVILSSISVLVPMSSGVIGICISFAIVGWCSFSAAKLFVRTLEMDHQQFLVAYPCALFYAVFLLLTMY